MYIDKIANKVYSWISASSVRHTEFQNLLEEMNIQVLEVLQIHDVRWLARGNVMKRLTKLMPGILSFWKTGARAWNDKLRMYKVLFSIYMLPDILHDMDMLNKVFQNETVDVTSFSTSIEVTLSSLRRKFLSPNFAKDTLYLKDFMDSTKEGVLMHTNEAGEEYVHHLVYACMPGKDKDGIPYDFEGGSVDACIAMAKQFVQKTIECINERFPDMYFFNATKLFNPQFYARDDKEREEKCVLWLSRLLDRLGGHIVDGDACRKELKAFVDVLYYGSMADFVGASISSVPCERGFSKQNFIKNDRRQSLRVHTLEMLMRISLLGTDAKLLDWEKLYEAIGDMMGWKRRKLQKDTAESHLPLVKQPPKQQQQEPPQQGKDSKTQQEEPLGHEETVDTQQQEPPERPLATPPQEQAGQGGETQNEETGGDTNEGDGMRVQDSPEIVVINLTNLPDIEEEVEAPPDEALNQLEGVTKIHRQSVHLHKNIEPAQKMVKDSWKEKKGALQKRHKEHIGKINDIMKVKDDERMMALARSRELESQLNEQR
ncbi:hypothetical protein L7F22_017480 [Adiantum nelumboides]|nr:hypothetical protein [Adiantum nelumboides]